MAIAARLDRRLSAAATALVATGRVISARGPALAALVVMAPSGQMETAAWDIARLRGIFTVTDLRIAARRIAMKDLALVTAGMARIAATVMESRRSSMAVCTIISGAAARRGLALEAGPILAPLFAADSTAAQAR